MEYKKYQNSFQSDKILLNSDLKTEQISNNLSSTIESYQPQNQNNYSKIDLGENDLTNIKLDERENVEDEDPEPIIKITNRIIKVEKSPAGTKFYGKKIISKTITKEGENETTIIKTSNFLNENNLNNNKATYTRPLPKGRYHKKTNNQTKNKIILPKTNALKKNNSRIKRNFDEDSTNQSLISSQSFAGNKLYLNEPDIINNSPATQRAHSPNPGLIKRKTITRGEEIKNVQITHIICSSKPSNFHITEKLETNNIKSNPIKISKTDREKLKKTGKSSYSSSCPDGIKPIVQNLKGKTTIYQHARGIGMTNDKKDHINPLFYNSEIKKLEPIVKEKEKVKVEYIENFRSNKYRNGNNLINTTKNFGKDSNNSSLYKNYNTVVSSSGSIANSVRINSNRGNNKGIVYNNKI
jgi:hypothetical protein